MEDTTGLLTPRVISWRERGHIEKFRDYKIHCFYQEGCGSGPLHVICHGYPTCSYDWIKVIDHLPSKAILLCDFLGFGLSDKPQNHVYTLAWQADLVEELIIRHNNKEEMLSEVREVLLIGHDMGTSVVAELLARDLETTSLHPNINLVGAFLMNGSMYMERANLILGQKILRSRFGWLASKLTFSLPFRWQLGRVFSSSHPLSVEEGEDQWALMSWQNGHKINDKLIQYTFERVEKAERWLGAVKNWKKPVAYAWGMKDPVCGDWQLEGWKELRPEAPLRLMEELGHYPMIENPEVFTQVLKLSLDAVLNNRS